MNCDDVDQALIEASATSRLPPQIQEHVSGCKRCQELVQAINVSDPADLPSPQTLRQIERSILANLIPVRHVPPARYLFAAFVGILVAVLAFGVYRMGSSSVNSKEASTFMFNHYLGNVAPN